MNIFSVAGHAYFVIVVGITKRIINLYLSSISIATSLLVVLYDSPNPNWIDADTIDDDKDIDGIDDDICVGVQQEAAVQHPAGPRGRLLHVGR